MLTHSFVLIGQKAFAVAIHVDPEILIVDEALAVGDLYFQAKCYRKFNEFKESGKTILFVTHALDSVLKYCDAALLMHGGELRMKGTPHDVIDEYKQVMARQPHDVEVSPACPADGESAWQPQIQVNPERLEYGDKAAEIVDFGLFGAEGAVSQCIAQGDECEIRMRVRVNRPIEELIYAFTIKDLMGIEISGTNTLYEGIELEETPGVFRVSFRMPCRLAAGQYLISLGVTSQRGTLVHHRLYDLIAFEVIASKPCAGVFEPEAVVQVIGERAGERAF